MSTTIEINGTVSDGCPRCGKRRKVTFYNQEFYDVDELTGHFICPGCEELDAEETKAEAEIKEGKEV